jgi:hypothetical protein
MRDLLRHCWTRLQISNPRRHVGDHAAGTTMARRRKLAGSVLSAGRSVAPMKVRVDVPDRPFIKGDVIRSCCSRWRP